MISYDPKYERILVYYTKIDYEDPRTYENNSDMETLEADIKTYADLAHGYNVIAYRYAEKQADGSFAWNTEYDEGEGLNPDKGFTPEELTNIVVGFTVMDDKGVQMVTAEKAIQFEARPVITVLGTKLTAQDTVRLSLNTQNTGNLDYEGSLDIAYASGGRKIKSVDLQLAPGETKKMDMDVGVDPSMFGEIQETENGSVYDELILKTTAGSCNQNAVIRRVADKSIMKNIHNVTSFLVDRSSVSLEPGTVKKLKTNILLKTPLPENTADPLKTVWTTSNKEVASVLPDGTVIGLTRGTAVITARLEPVRNTTISLPDGSFEKVGTTDLLPAGIVKTDSVVVHVGERADDETDDDKTDNTVDKSQNAPELSEEPGIVEMKPDLAGQTGTITPDRKTIANALKTIREGGKPALTFILMDEIELTVSKLVLSKDVLTDIADNGVVEMAFETPGNRITLEEKALDCLHGLLSRDGEKQEITIQVSRWNTESYSDELREMTGNRPVYDFSIFIGEQNITALTDDPVPLTLEFLDLTVPEALISQNQIVGACIADDGQYELIPLSGVKDDKFVIKTTHNSVYGTLRHAVEFHDNTGWSKDAVDFLATRGIVNGVGNQKFAPLQNITRGEVVKMMAALAGKQIDRSAVPASSFADVDPDKWYAPYIEWAYLNGLVNGVGNGRFAPDENITRQDMAVLIARLADRLEYPLPVVNEEITFVDHSAISNYSREAVKSVQQAGILQGRPGLIFAPKAYATREECAEIIALLIRLIISE